jgi:hypothetical protein
MNEVTKATTSGLPANFTAGLANVRTAAKQAAQPEAGLYLKMGKDGIWTYGREDTPAEKGARYAVNIPNAMHGYTGWGDKKHDNEGSPLGDELVSIAEPIPAKSSLPQIDGTWSQAGALQLACIAGEDKGVQLIFKTNSMGGLEAFGNLLTAFADRVESGAADIIPVIELDNTSYKHTTYGKIYKPVLTVVGWVPLEGAVPAEDDSQDAEPAPAKKKKKKEKAAKKAEKEAKFEEVDEEEEEAQEPPRRRRSRTAA